MTTLITWETGSGKKGRCDGKCHNAKGKRCHCGCGGRYHGAARDGTLAQKQSDFQETIFAELKANGCTPFGQIPLSLG
jgi:hypothetical protein